MVSHRHTVMRGKHPDLNPDPRPEPLALSTEALGKQLLHGQGGAVQQSPKPQLLLRRHGPSPGWHSLSLTLDLNLSLPR